MAGGVFGRSQIRWGCVLGENWIHWLFASAPSSFLATLAVQIHNNTPLTPIPSFNSLSHAQHVTLLSLYHGRPIPHPPEKTRRPQKSPRRREKNSNAPSPLFLSPPLIFPQHQAESARLKSDLARCQKTILDQTSQIDRQTKHADALEARVQDLKHAALADQSQIISLKAKLKAADRDSKLADLEKSLASETTRRVSLEAQLQNLRSKGDNDIQAARTGANQLASLQQELSNARESFSRERHAFISRLEHSSSLLSHAAQQYASLASTTVPSSTHRKLKRLYLSSEFKILRLERKLGNAEDQVNELAHLVRQVNDRNDLLKSQLADANYQLSVYETMLNAAPPPDTPQLEDLGWEPARIEEDLVVKASEARLSELLAVYYNLCSQQLLFAYTCLDKDLSQTSSLVKQQAKDLTSAHASHKSTAANLEAVQTERSSLSNQLTELQGTNATLKRICASLEAQVTSLQNQQQQLVLEHKAEMKKDKDVVQRLTSVAQKNKMAEDALRAEIDR
jgi:chromosome segregation ATPase